MDTPFKEIETLPNDLQLKELEARRMAHRCPVYAPGEPLEKDAAYKATISGQRSAACGERWMEARRAINEAGFDPLPLDFSE